MPVFLSERQDDLTEWMDRSDCDLTKLYNTYRQFYIINVLLSNWKKIYRTRLLPLFNTATPPYSLLDIGFGGGDIPLAIAKWARKDGIDLSVTAIENDSRAFNYVTKLPNADNVVFRKVSSGDLLLEEKTYDVVISNHLLHHLEGRHFNELLNDAQKLAGKMVLFNDIERSDIGYALFNTLTRPVFFNSFIIDDGLTSIKRSYTKNELEHKAPAGWKVERSFPFRLLLTYEHT